MNQMNQIGINKQQKTQKNTKKINFVIFVKSVGKKHIAPAIWFIRFVW